MLKITCPCCGERDYTEFRYGSDATKPRPPLASEDRKAWHDYVFLFDNPKGPHREFWQHVLGCRHLLSHRGNGIEIQVYLAMIVCMLIALWTGRKPTLRTIEMLRFYFTGWADVEEVEAHIAKLAKLQA